jgi:hypothetical protein
MHVADGATACMPGAPPKQQPPASQGVTSSKPCHPGPASPRTRSALATTHLAFCSPHITFKPNSLIPTAHSARKGTKHTQLHTQQPAAPSSVAHHRTLPPAPLGPETKPHPCRPPFSPPGCACSPGPAHPHPHTDTRYYTTQCTPVLPPRTCSPGPALEQQPAGPSIRHRPSRSPTLAHNKTTRCTPSRFLSWQHLQPRR